MTGQQGDVASGDASVSVLQAATSSNEVMKCSEATAASQVSVQSDGTLGRDHLVAKTVATSLPQAAVVDTGVSVAAVTRGIFKIEIVRLAANDGQRRRKRQRRSSTDATSGDAKQQSPT